MKMKLFSIALFILYSLFYHPLFSQDTTQNRLTFGGSLQTDTRFRLTNKNDISWHETRLNVSMELKPNDKTSFYSEVWFRSFGTPSIKSSNNLFNSTDVTSLSIQFREGYIDLYGFLVDNLDLRVGRQRIAWGTADKLNPTDNLNPPDLEDIWDFGRHLSSDGIKATYYHNDITLTLVYIPIFTPAILPRGDWSIAFIPETTIPSLFTVNEYSDAIMLPKQNIWQSSTAGIKISKKFSTLDFSLSYKYGRDYLPLLKTVQISSTTTPGMVNIHSELMYPRMDVVGVDLASELARVGLWAEAAIFIPKKVIMITDLSALGMGIQRSIVLDNKPYVKYVVGGDYTFLNGLYIHCQYVHGFIHERGSHNLEDYFFVSLEWKTFDDKLKIIPFGGGIEVKDFNHIGSSYGFVLAPEVTYFHTQNSEISLGVRIIEGKNTTLFGRIRSNDEIYARVNYNF